MPLIEFPVENIIKQNYRTAYEEFKKNEKKGVTIKINKIDLKHLYIKVVLPVG